MCFYLLYEICVCLKARVYNDVIKLSCTLAKGQKVNIIKCWKQQLRQRECIYPEEVGHKIRSWSWLTAGGQLLSVITQLSASFR